MDGDTCTTDICAHSVCRRKNKTADLILSQLYLCRGVYAESPSNRGVVYWQSLGIKIICSKSKGRFLRRKTFRRFPPSLPSKNLSQNSIHVPLVAGVHTMSDHSLVSRGWVHPQVSSFADLFRCFTGTFVVSCLVRR